MFFPNKNLPWSCTVGIIYKNFEKDNIAVVAHQASLVNSKTHLIDTLLSLGVNIKKVFAPEHGFREMLMQERVADQKTLNRSAYTFPIWQ